MRTVNGFNPKGRFVVEHRDVNGRLKGTYDMPNDIVDEGKDKILDDMFNDGSQTANNSWFIGLIDLSGFTELLPGDTAAVHGGWNEFTSYSEGNRVAWGSGAASSESVTNSTPATFNISGSGDVKGIFLITNNTKGAFTGLLWATSLFAADVPVTNGDQLKVTYTVSA